MARSSFPMGSDFIMAIASAVGIDASRVRHIVIDAEVGRPVMVYVEQFGDDRLLKVDWPSTLKDASVKFADSKEE